MTVLQGAGVAVISAAVTLLAVALAGLAMVAFQIQEERRGNGCRRAGCRRSRMDQGWLDAWGDDGPSPRFSHKREDQ